MLQFHQRNVLVGRRVEYGMRPKLGEHRAQADFVTNVDDCWLDDNVRERSPHLFEQFENRILTAAYSDDLCRTELRELTTQLAADRSPGAGHHHRAAGDQ